MDTDQLICYCGKVTVGMIKEAMDRGAETVEQVGEMTGAGTHCGGCETKIAKLMEELKK